MESKITISSRLWARMGHATYTSTSASLDLCLSKPTSRSGVLHQSPAVWPLLLHTGMNKAVFYWRVDVQTSPHKPRSIYLAISNRTDPDRGFLAMEGARAHQAGGMIGQRWGVTRILGGRRINLYTHRRHPVHFGVQPKFP